MKNWNSKWDYIICGMNMIFAFVGAMDGSLPLLLVGVGTAIWSWYIAEAKRHLEEEEVLLIEGEENGKDNEEDK